MMRAGGLGFILILDGNRKQKQSYRGVSRFPQTGQDVKQFCFLVPLCFVSIFFQTGRAGGEGLAG